MAGGCLLAAGLGVGVFATPNSLLILGEVERRQYGMASGILGTMRTLGMAVTLAFTLFMDG